MSNLNVQKEKWLEIAFEGRNKNYGAYQLRKESDRTTTKAMLITFGALTLGIGLFSFAIPKNKPEVVFNCPTIRPSVVIIETQKDKIAPPKPKGTDKPKLNLTPTNPIPKIIDNPEVEPVVEPKNPDPTTPYNPDGVVNGNPEPAGDPNGTSTTPTNSGTDTGSSTNKVYKGVFGVEASFPGGINKFRTYIAENYKIPNSFNKDVLKIELVFVIEIDGSMTDIKMVSNVNKDLEKEAIRVLKAMNKKWTPGKVNGEFVRSEKKLPIEITITETDE